jgi:hypothetical protein
VAMTFGEICIGWHYRVNTCHPERSEGSIGYMHIGYQMLHYVQHDKFE